MAGESAPALMNLSAILETTLDPKGFEDFKAGVEGATTTVKGSLPPIEAAGGAFEQLGHRLPHAAFHLLSYDMLEQAGIQSHLRPLVVLSSTAMEGLAAATGAASSAFGYATLGLGLLIPLVLSMRKHTEEGADATKLMVRADEDLIEKLETLKTKTGHLTDEQERLEAALLRVRNLQQQSELDKVRKQIEETTAAMEEENAKTHQLAMTMGRGGEIRHQEIKLSREHAEAAAKTAVELRNLKDQETILLAQMNGTTHGIEGQIKHLDDLARAARQAQEQQDRNVVESINERNRLHREAYNREVDLSLAALAKIEKEEQQKTQQLREQNRQRMEIIRHRYDQEVEQNQRAADLSQQVEENKRAAIQQTVAASISFLGSMFGKNKAAAIANAIMNTYEGATKALAEGGAAGPFMAAAVIASGMADVAAIEKQNAGFDDPGNDSIVREAFKSFGRGWAADMTQLAREGAAGGFGEGLQRAGAVTNNSNSRTTINRGTHIGTAVFNSLLGTPGQAMAAFERRRIRVARKEDRTRRRSL